jgi:hypothetical protein
MSMVRCASSAAPKGSSLRVVGTSVPLGAASGIARTTKALGDSGEATSGDPRVSEATAPVVTFDETDGEFIDFLVDEAVREWLTNSKG